MISIVLCGRFYKIFVSPMLHRNPSQISLRGIFRLDCLTIDLFDGQIVSDVKNEL